METMEQVHLGRNRVPVTRLGFGAAVIAGLFRAVDADEAAGALQTAWDAGVRYFDTAPHYGTGLSEERLGRFLAGRPGATVSTKVGRLLEPVEGPFVDDEGFVGGLPNRRVRDYSASGVRRSLEASLERTGLERIDIVYVHDPDDFEAEARAGALPELLRMRDEGLVGAVGVGMNQWQMPLRFVREFDLDAVMLAGRYTLLDRTGEPLLAACVERGVDIVAAGVFNSGVLIRPAPGAHFDYGPAPQHVVETAQLMARVCAAHGIELAAAAAQFPLRHPAVPCVVLGMRNAEQAASTTRLLEVDIPDDLWAALDRVGPALS